MASTNFTATDLARIDAAIAQNVLSVTFADGRSVTFSSFGELVQRRNFIAKQLGKSQGRQRLFGKYRRGIP